jgi:group I intron endonuclease
MKFIYQEHSLKSGIYKILNTHTNRIYIGQAQSFKKRWYQHSRSLENIKHQNKFLQADFKKCREELGHDDFLEFHVLEVMEESTKEERGLREEHWIGQWFDSGKQCYNFTHKAISREGCPSKNPEETKARKSAKGKEVWSNPTFRDKMLSKLRSGINSPSWGKKHTPEAIEKIKAARALQEYSAETRNKMSTSRMGHECSEETKQKIGEKNHQKMKELWQNSDYRQNMIEKARHEQTNETRIKISESMKGKKKSPETLERMREAQRKWRAEKA